MNVLTFENDGPLLVASNYWQSEIAAAGKLYVSINAGCFRLLVPQSQHAVISDIRPKAKHFVVSMLPSLGLSPLQLTALRTTKTLAKSGAAASGHTSRNPVRTNFNRL
jgi:hypothetical protein